MDADNVSPVGNADSHGSQAALKTLVRRQVQYLTGVSARPFRFDLHDFQPVLQPKVLRDKGKADLGTEEADREGLSVRVTSLERTLVDVLDRPDLGGGYEEIWRSLESVEFLDLDKVIRYALLLNDATTVAKVGYFLDQHRDLLMVEDKHLKPLRRRSPNKPQYLDRRRKAPVRFVPAWNLVVPRALAERVWQEVE